MFSQALTFSPFYGQFCVFFLRQNDYIDVYGGVHVGFCFNSPKQWHLIYNPTLQRLLRFCKGVSACQVDCFVVFPVCTLCVSGPIMQNALCGSAYSSLTGSCSFFEFIRLQMNLFYKNGYSEGICYPYQCPGPHKALCINYYADKQISCALIGIG